MPTARSTHRPHRRALRCTRNRLQQKRCTSSRAGNCTQINTVAAAKRFKIREQISFTQRSSASLNQARLCSHNLQEVSPDKRWHALRSYLPPNVVHNFTLLKPISECDPSSLVFHDFGNDGHCSIPIDGDRVPKGVAVGVEGCCLIGVGRSIIFTSAASAVECRPPLPLPLPSPVEDRAA